MEASDKNTALRFPWILALHPFRRFGLMVQRSRVLKNFLTAHYSRIARSAAVAQLIKGLTCAVPR